MDTFRGGTRNFFSDLKLCFKEHSYASLIWLVNIVPSLVGFSLLKNERAVPFFLLNICLLLYVYGVGTVVYQMYFAETTMDFVKSSVNISLFMLIANNSYWWITQKKLLRSTLEEISESDRLAAQNIAMTKKHKNLIKKIKLILLVFYATNYSNAILVYIPNRSQIDNNYSITPCYGMEPLHQSPNGEICRMFLTIQEITIMIGILSFQALFVVLISYTEILYHMLADEMVTLNDFDREKYVYNPKVKELLPFLIRRHVMITRIIDKLKALFSVPIGVNFGTNAACISLFFFLPLPAWLPFMPILCYCFLVFFLYCYLCQRLSNAAEMFESAVYGCGWHSFEVKDKKAVLVMLHQAQKPVELLAADIIPVNIATFATTCQAMYKFVTVVKL